MCKEVNASVKAGFEGLYSPGFSPDLLVLHPLACGTANFQDSGPRGRSERLQDSPEDTATFILFGPALLGPVPGHDQEREVPWPYGG